LIDQLKPSEGFEPEPNFLCITFTRKVKALCFYLHGKSFLLLMKQTSSVVYTWTYNDVRIVDEKRTDVPRATLPEEIKDPCPNALHPTTNHMRASYKWKPRLQARR
jgi:hypothetical protein